MAVVSVIAMLDKHFSVRLKPNDIKPLVTVEDILAHMKEKEAEKVDDKSHVPFGKEHNSHGASSGIGLATTSNLRPRRQCSDGL